MLKSQTITLTSATSSLRHLRGRKASFSGNSGKADRSLPASTEGAVDCVTGLRRIVYVALGAFFVVLAVLGIALPGLPTTPFLLLASFFLSRSWPKFHQKIIKNRVFGPIIRDWQTHKAVRQRTKYHASLLVGLAMMLLCLSGLPPVWIGSLLSLTIVGQLVIYRLPTIDQTSTAAV